tara:strand:- start:166 stop:639 length:474 start_codon:yes stop_codon:yes gene_type:complete
MGWQDILRKREEFLTIREMREILNRPQWSDAEEKAWLSRMGIQGDLDLELQEYLDQHMIKCCEDMKQGFAEYWKACWDYYRKNDPTHPILEQSYSDFYDDAIKPLDEEDCFDTMKVIVRYTDNPIRGDPPILNQMLQRVRDRFEACFRENSFIEDNV